jgi:hypothetical protein
MSRTDYHFSEDLSVFFLIFYPRMTIFSATFCGDFFETEGAESIGWFGTPWPVLATTVWFSGTWGLGVLKKTQDLPSGKHTKNY